MILSFEIRLKCGSMEFYNKTYDRVTTKSEKKLERINRIFHKVTTTDDPIIRRVTTHPPLTSGPSSNIPNGFVVMFVAR